MDDWDTWRIKRRDPGDPSNPNVTPKRYSSRGLFNAVVNEYPKDIMTVSTERGRLVDGWVHELQDDAEFNFESYAQCFIAENLIRKYLAEQSIQLTLPAKKEVEEYRVREERSKKKSVNVSIEIRKTDDPLTYLSIETLSKVAEGSLQNTNNLVPRFQRIQPLRDAVMHTAQLSDQAKKKLSTVFDNIKARVAKLLSGGS